MCTNTRFGPLVSVLAAGVALLTSSVGSAAPSCVRVVSPLAGGAFVQTGERIDGYYLAGNTIVDYFGGGPKEYRNWFAFKLPPFPAPLVSAELRIFSGTTVSPSGSETWELHQISGAGAITNLLRPPRILDSNGIPVVIPSPQIYADLADGPAFGSIVISTNQNPRNYYDPGALMVVPFNGAGLTALTAAQGTNFVFGGVVSTLDGDTNTSDLVFFNTVVGVWPIELVLNFGDGVPTVDTPVWRGGVDILWKIPTTTSVFAGDSYTLEAYACGQVPMTFQWLLNGQPLPGAISDVYYQSLATPAQNGAYQLKIVNGGGSVTSAPVQVQVRALSVRTDLQPQTVMEGDNAGLTFIVDSLLPLTYEWRRDGVLLGNQRNYYLENGVQSGDAGNYQVVARNSFGSVTSSVAHLTVLLRPPTISTPLSDILVAAGTPFQLYVNAYGHEPISFRWFKDGVLLSGETNRVLSRSSAQFSDAGRYSVQLSNDAGSVSGGTALVTVRAYTAIYGPYNTSAYWGSPANFVVSALGALPQTVSWYHNGVLVPSVTDTQFLFNAVTPEDGGQYYAIVSNAFGSITSQVATLTVVQGPPLIWISLVESTPTVDGLPKITAGTPALFDSRVQAGPPARLQWERNGVAIPGATNELYFIPSLTPSDSGEYTLLAANPFGTNRSRGIELEVVTAPPTVDIAVSESVVRPMLQYPQLAAGTLIRFASIVRGSPPVTLQWIHGNTPLPGQTNSTLLIDPLTLSDSGAYRLTASNAYGQATSAPIDIEVVIERPFFGLVPNVSQATIGEMVALRSQAAGSPPLHYQWRFQNADLPGETNSTLLLTPTSVAQSGLYEIVVSNGGGETRATNMVTVRSDGNLDHWQWRLPQPQGSRLKGVAYGNGRYVAVGRAGNIVWSSNGVDWVNVRIPADVQLESVIWAGDRFVTSGNIITRTTATPYSGWTAVTYQNQVGLTFVSADGEHWMAGAPLPDGWLFNMAYGNGIIVACGSLARTWTYTSVDGRTWTPRYNGGSAAYVIAFGNDTFLASAGGTHYLSSDGIAWSEPLTPSFSTYGLTFGNGVFLASSSEQPAAFPLGLVAVSTDAVHWQTHRLTNFPYFATIAAGNDRYVVLAPDQSSEQWKGRLAESTDLDTWTIVDTGANQELEALTYGAGRFITVGEAGTILRSGDGVVWAAVPVANDIDYYGLAGNGQRLVAAGDDGTILTSDDGRTWTLRATPSGRNLHGVAYGNGLFVAVGRRGLLMTSPDGVQWTRRESGVTNYLERVSYANGRWVAVGEQGDMSTSVNGIDWRPLSSGAPFTDHEGIAYGLGRWIAVGGYFGQSSEDESPAISSFYTSTDGTNWLLVPFNTGKRFRDIAFADGLFVAVGNDRVIATSPDGFNWTHYFLPRQREEDNLRRVTHAYGRWVVVGNDGRLISSTDPTNDSQWREHLSHTSQNLHDIVPSLDGGFVAVGNNGMLLQSTEPRPYIAAIRLTPNGTQLSFSTGFVTPPLRLEGSTDLRTWQTVANNVQSPFVVPASAETVRFFRLVSP